MKKQNLKLCCRCGNKLKEYEKLPYYDTEPLCDNCLAIKSNSFRRQREDRISSFISLEYAEKIEVEEAKKQRIHLCSGCSRYSKIPAGCGMDFKKCPHCDGWFGLC